MEGLFLVLIGGFMGCLLTAFVFVYAERFADRDRRRWAQKRAE